jgi:hypothetical protein
LTFGNPQLLFLLFILPLIVLLHLIRTRRKDLRISSLYLWQRVLSEYSRTFRLRRLLNNINLLLQILAATAVIFAIADPHFLRESIRDEGNIIAIVDTTASMQAKSDGSSRIEQARGVALDIVENMAEESQFMLIEARAKPHLISPFSQDREALGQLIRSISPTDEPGDLSEAILMAISLADAEDRIHVITDGTDESPGIINLEKARVSFHEVGGEIRNVAITQFQFRPLIGRPEEYEVMIQLSNYTEEEVTTTLTVDLEGAEVLREEIRLGASTDEILIYPYSVAAAFDSAEGEIFGGLKTGRIVAEIDFDDDLAVDNRAYTVLSESPEIAVLLVSRGNFFLESLVSAFPDIIAESYTQYVDQRNYDVIIMDSISPPPLEFGNFLLINALPSNIPITSLGFIDNPRIVSWETDHPLMASLNLKDVNITRAVMTEQRGAAQPLVHSEQTPLIYTYERDRLRLVYLGFDILQSDFPLRVAFPLFLRNVLKWLHPGSLSATSRYIQAGTPYPISTRGDTQALRVDSPGGPDLFEVNENPFLYEHTSTAGFYRIASPTALEREFAVNLLSGKESDANPRHFFSQALPAAEDEARLSTGRIRVDLWPYFVIFALLLILTEWYFWVRKW